MAVYTTGIGSSRKSSQTAQEKKQKEEEEKKKKEEEARKQQQQHMQQLQKAAAKEASSKKKMASSNGGKTSTVRANERATGDWEHDSAVVQSRLAPYSRANLSRQNARQQKTESYMDLTTANEPKARAGIEMYKAKADAQKYVEMNKVGYRNYDQDTVNRSVKGYEESYQRWKKVYDANKGPAAVDLKTSRQSEIRAQAQTIQRYTDTGTGGKDAQADDNRWAGVTDRLKHLGSMQRNVDTPGAKKNYSEEFHPDQVRKQYREAYEQAFPSGQTAKQTSVTDRYSAANGQLRAAERDAYYWEQAAKDAAWFGDEQRFTRSLPHITESGRRAQGALAQFRAASDEMAGAVREQDEALKQGDLATWYARNLSDDEIRRRLEEEQKPLSVTDKDRAENPGMYPDAAFRTMPRQSSFDPTMTAGGEAPGNRFYMTEEERQLTEQSDRYLLQQKVNDREVQIAALERAQQAHHERDLEQEVYGYALSGRLSDMAKQGQDAMRQDMSNAQAHGNNPMDVLAQSGSAEEALALFRGASAVTKIWRNLTKCSDEQKERVYAMYSVDPQKAVELSQKYYDDAMDAYYAQFYNWANSKHGWQAGRRLAAGLLGTGAKLLSGLDPFGDSGQDLSRAGEAFIGGASESASRNGLFGIDVLGGDESPISGNVPYIGRGRAGEAAQLGTSILESSAIAVPAMLIGRYDVAASKVAGLLGTTLMGSSAAADDYRESIRNGLTESQALAHATAAGIAEAAFEYISLDRLIDPGNIKKGLIRWLTQGGIEASEEVCTTIANRISDEVIANFSGIRNSIEREALEYQLHGYSAEEAEAKAQNQWLSGLMMDGLGGLFSGIIMGGGSDVMQRGLSRVNSAMDTAAENYGSGFLLQLETAGYTNADTLDALTSYALANNIDVKALMDAQAKAAVSDQGAVVSVQETHGAETGNSQEAIGNSGRETTDRAEDGTPLIRQPEGLTPSPEGEGFDGGLETKDGGLGSARPTETKEGESAQTRSTENGEANENGEKPRLSKRNLRRAGKVRAQIVESLSSQFEGKTAAEQAAAYDSLVESYGSGIEAVASEALYNTARRNMQSVKNVPTLEQQHGTDAEAFQSETARNAVERAYRDTQAEIMRATGDTTESSVRSLRDASRRAGDGFTMQAEITDKNGSTRTVDIKGWNQNGTKVVLQDGTQADVDSLQADAATKDLLEAMKDAKLGAYADEAFQTFVTSGAARSLADGHSWIAGYRGAFGVGEVRGNVTQAVQLAARYGVDMETAAAAYYNGVKAVDADTARRTATVEKAVQKAGKAGVSGKTAVIDNSRISWDELGREQKDQKKFLDKVAQAYGVDVVWFDSAQDGKLGAMQGKYQDGAIWLDVNAGKNAVTDSAVAILGTMGHEMTHMMQDYSPKLYQEYRDFALDSIRSVEGEAGLERMIQDRIDNRNRNIEKGETDSSGNPLREMSREEAIDEVVARFSEKIFSQEESMQTRLKDLQGNHRDLWEKIKDFFKGWLDRVRKMLQQDTGFAKKELQIWDRLSDEIQKRLATMWGEGTADMARNLDLTEGVKLSEVSSLYSERDTQEILHLKDQIRNNQNTLNQMPIVGEAFSEIVFDEDNVYAAVEWACKKIGVPLTVHRDGLGDVFFDRKRVNKGFNYLPGRKGSPGRNILGQAYTTAVTLAPKVVQVGIEINHHINHKDYGHDTWTFSAPVEIDGKRGNLAVVVKKTSDNYYDVHSILTPTGELMVLDAKKIAEASDGGALTTKDVAPSKLSADLSIRDSPQKINPQNEKYSEREADMPSDVELVMGMDEKDADTPEGKALIREVQAKQKQIEALTEKLAEAKRQLTTTKRALNTKGIGNVAGNVIRDFGISDAGGKNIRQQATGILTEAYQKALDQIDSGATAAEAWETVYNAAVEAAELLIDQGRYTENNNGKRTNVPYSQYIGEDRQMVIDQMVSEAAVDFSRNRYRGPIQETAADRLVARTEKRMQGKLDETKAKNAELKAENERLEQDITFLKDQADGARFAAGNLYDQVKDLRQELKDNRKLTAQERKTVQKKIDGLNRQIDAKKAEAAAWRDRANRNASLLKSALESKSRDIQTVKDESQRQVDRAVAEKEAAVRKLEAQIDREKKILSGELRAPGLVKLLKAEREKAEARVKKQKEAQFARYKEGKKAGELRRRIVRHSKELYGKLTKPSDKRHIPEAYRGAVAALLNTINLESAYDIQEGTKNETGRGGKHVEKGTGTATNRTKAFQEVRKQLEQVLAEGGFTGELINNASEGFDGGLIEKCQDFADKPVSTLNSEELETLWNTIRALEHNITTFNKAFALAKTETISGLADSFLASAQKRKPLLKDPKSRLDLKIKKTSGAALKALENPYTFFSHYGEEGVKLYRALRDAQDLVMVRTNHLSDLWVRKMAAILGDEKTAKLHGDKLTDAILDKIRDTSKQMDEKVETFKLENGQTLTLTHAMLMDVYLLAQRGEVGMNHLLGSGLIQPEIRAKGKYVARDPSFRKLSLEDVQKLTEVIAGNETEKAVADAIQSMQHQLADWGNEASMAVFGYRKFTEDNYWPVKNAKEENKSDSGKGGNQPANAMNKGMAKNLVPHAATGMEPMSAFTKLQGSISDMLVYATWGPVMEDFKRFYNWKWLNPEGGTSDTVKGVMERYGGEGSQRYWEELRDQINNGVGGGKGSADQLIGKAVGAVKGARVAFNLRVVVQQPTAYARAGEVISGKYLAASLLDIKSWGWKAKSAWNRALTHSPIAMRKDSTTYDMGGNISAGGEFGLDRPGYLDKARDFGTTLAGKADAITWGRLWHAAELQVSARTKLEYGSQEYWDAVNKLFTEAVDRTQVVDGLLQRPAIMRTDSDFVKGATAYMGEPLMQLNMLMRQVNDFRQTGLKQTKKQIGKTVSALVVTQLINAMLTGLYDAGIRKDDDDKDFWERFMAEITGLDGSEGNAWDYITSIWLESNVTSEMSVMQKVPLAKDLLSMLQGYDPSNNRMDLEAIKDLMDVCTKVLWNDKYTPLHKAKELINKASMIFGAGFGNALKDMYGVTRNIINDFGNPQARFDFKALWLNPASKKNKSQYFELLFQMLENGDKAAFRKRAKAMAGQEGMLQFVAKAAIERYLTDGLSPADVWDMMETARDEGMSDEKFYDYAHERMADAFQANYFAGKLEDDQALKLLLQYAGKDEEKAWNAVRKWKDQSKYLDKDGKLQLPEDYKWNQYDELKTAIAAGEDIGELVQTYKNHGYSDKRMNKAVRAGIQGTFDKGTYTADEAVQALIRYGVTWSKDGKTYAYDQNKGWQTVREWAANAEHKDEDGNLEEGYSYSLYDDLRGAIEAGSGIDAAMKELTDHGVKASDVNEVVNKTVLKLYTDGEISEKTAIGLLTKYHTLTKDKKTRAQTADEAWAALQKASATAAHADEEDYSYSKYDDIDAALDKNADISKLVKQLTDHGEKQANITNHVKSYLTSSYVDGKMSEDAFKNRLSRYCGITKTDEVAGILKDANCKKDCGYGWSDLKNAYGNGDLSASAAKKMLQKHGGLSAQGAEHRLGYWDYCKKNPDTKIEAAGWDTYYEKQLPTVGGTLSSRGLKLSSFTEYREKRAQLEVTDLDGDGKKDEKAYVLNLINSMKLSTAEKDMLYYYNGYGARELWKTPWH